MSNTVITNYTDLNGPSTKADSSVVVIVNKDGSLSVDQNLLGTLMGTDGTQGAISVVRVGHEGKPDDATDSETEDDKVHHVTLSVDSYYDEPNSIIKYDSGAEMLQSLRIETRENSLVGFQNDHCYTPLISPSQELPKRNDNLIPYDDSIIEIKQTPPPAPPKPMPDSKKITILEQKIIPKGKKILINSATELPVILKGKDILNKPLLPVNKKSKDIKSAEKVEGNQKPEDNVESSSSISSSGESIPDRDSDSDYKDTKDKTGSLKLRKTKLKPRILKSVHSTKVHKLEIKVTPRLKANKNLMKSKVKITPPKNFPEAKDTDVDLESLLPTNKISTIHEVTPKEISKVVIKPSPKPIKKEKKTPAHVSALLSDMTSLFSTPDVIRRVSTDNKPPVKETLLADKKSVNTIKLEVNEGKNSDTKLNEGVDKAKTVTTPKVDTKPKDKTVTQPDKNTRPFDTIPQLDEASLSQILQDTPNAVKTQPSVTPANTITNPSLAGPLSPTLDLLGGLQPEEEGLTEDLLMHVAQLVESSENLQEVIDKQVLGKVDSTPVKTAVQSPFQLSHSANLYTQTLSKTVQKNITQRKDPIEIVRRDGRVITLPPIEAPATRSKRRSQVTETSIVTNEVVTVTPNVVNTTTLPEPQIPTASKQYVNKKLTNKKQETLLSSNVEQKISADTQESWNSEDDPNRLWCICKQPHNNRFMICCDSCEDWFHGKCVNITKAMGQQMEEQGIEWRCPNCIKKAKSTPRPSNKTMLIQKKLVPDLISNETTPVPVKEMTSKTSCIVCKKSARSSSIYCSDSCILKHAQDSLGGNQTPNNKDMEPGKSAEKQKSDSRVIVYERKSGRLLAGPNAPTAENLKAWLQRNPTFEVVRPGTLSTIKPNTSKKKSLSDGNKIQTTLNFQRIPRKSVEQPSPGKLAPADTKEKILRPLQSPKEEIKTLSQPKTPVASKSSQIQLIDTPRPSTSTAKPVTEPRKLIRSMSSKSQSSNERSPVTTPTLSRKREFPEHKIRMNTDESIRDNVRKSLQEQLAIRMAENEATKFTDEEIQQFAVATEAELHDLFRDVGMKYKAKYRSLMFNIKDRKNLTLWEKICDKSITPKQLVRLSPEELASQELAQWRDKEAKYQLELIKKSELDLLAASKTYVLKTHKGEEVMETKESVSTELDPNVPVEDVVQVLNETINDEVPQEKTVPLATKPHKLDKKRSSSRKRENSSTSPSKKSKKDHKRDSERKSRSSKRRESGSREKQSKEVEKRSTRSSDKKSSKSRSRSTSKDRAKPDVKEKPEASDRSRRRSRSRDKSTIQSKPGTVQRSSSRIRERSKSNERTRRQSSSIERTKERRSSRSKRNSASADDKLKQRSRSQENVPVKVKHDSTDSDSIERPKSAMLKEAHPEYDPHEPMITSAFSEDDLRKSREDIYEETYENEMRDVDADYDPSKSFALSTSVTMPSSIYIGRRQNKAAVPAEAESDQEPSSTVENATATVWNGCINMVDVARFYVAAHEVSGSAVDLEEDLTTELDIVGRINPDTVWDYIAKMKKASNKDIVILRLHAANDEERMQYIALYSYLSSRNRLGVVKVSSSTTVKDFYILPLPANTSLPEVLLPLDGAGLGEVKTHLLIAIVIRQRKKRLASHIPKDVTPAKVARQSQKRSYTPPVISKGSHTPPASPKRRAQLPLPQYPTTALSTTVKDKIAASLACNDEDEAYSPGSSSSNGSLTLPKSTGSSNTLRSKMEELNRQIEEQKQQIRKMAQANSSAGEDEAYSPSRPMTPSPPNVPLSDIALPSNLQEILATIKQRSETTADVDMRTLPLP